MTYLHASEDKLLQRRRKTLETILLVTLKNQPCDVWGCFGLLLSLIKQNLSLYRSLTCTLRTAPVNTSVED